MAKLVNMGLHTWHDFAAKAAERLTNAPLPGAASSSASNDLSFSDGVLLDGAVRMANDGWPEGAKVLSDALDSLPPESDVRPDWATDVCGAFPCVPALVAGDPECMWNMSGERGYRQVALIVPMSYSASVDAKQVSIYAQAVAAIARSIEASGVDVAIYSVHHGQNRNNERYTGAHAVMVRQFGEPLDLAKVAFAFHSAFLRRLSFAWRERNPEAIKIKLADDTYGSPRPVTADIVRTVCGEVGQNVILPSVNDLFLHSSPELTEVLKRFRDVCDKAMADMGGAS